MSMRIGIGYDLHRTKPGKQIILGGVEIPAPFGLEGHSDADLLLHAITDALLGAIGDKDIGYYFPPGDEENRNRPSVDFLKFAHELVQKAGYSIANIDTVIVCERPKIKPVREEIKENISLMLSLKPGQIGVKAKTSEEVGAIGRQEAMAAQAVVLLSANP